jgi:hypothetical protein
MKAWLVHVQSDVSGLGLDLDQTVLDFQFWKLSSTINACFWTALLTAPLIRGNFLYTLLRYLVGFPFFSKYFLYNTIISWHFVPAYYWRALDLKALLRIHDILLWIRIHGSMPMTNGSGFGCGSGCGFRNLLFWSMTLRCQQKTNNYF